MSEYELPICVTASSTLQISPHKIWGYITSAVSSAIN